MFDLKACYSNYKYIKKYINLLVLPSIKINRRLSRQYYVQLLFGTES